MQGETECGAPCAFWGYIHYLDGLKTMHAAASVSSCRGTTHWRIIAASALGIALGLGILVGRQSRLSVVTAPACASRAEVALVIMTKDDWPLASRWLAWHGHVYGFEHLYVFDGSTGAQKDRLRDVTANYPIHLRHSLFLFNVRATPYF